MHLICLHNVVPAPLDVFDENCARISTEAFEAFLDNLQDAFDLVSYQTYVARLRDGDIRDTCVALSFDDGFLGVHDYALPSLAARGLTAIAFINPAFLGNPPGEIFHFLELEIAFRLTSRRELRVSFWEAEFDLTKDATKVKALKRVKKLLKTRPEAERVRGHAEVMAELGVSRPRILDMAQSLPQFRVMAPQHVRALLSSGWEIGSHAMTHRTLSMLSDADRNQEIGEAARALDHEFGLQATAFAYPYGDEIHVGKVAPQSVAAAGHPLAFSTIPGASRIDEAPHMLPRIDYARFLREYGLPGAA